MSRKDNEKKETKPRKTEETSIGREIWEYVKMIAIVVAVVVLWSRSLSSTQESRLLPWKTRL